MHTTPIKYNEELNISHHNLRLNSKINAPERWKETLEMLIAFNNLSFYDDLLLQSYVKHEHNFYTNKHSFKCVICSGFI